MKETKNAAAPERTGAQKGRTSVKNFRNGAPRKGGRLRWLWVWLIQIAATLAISLPIALSLWLGKYVHAVCMWGLAPIAGFAAACIATRRGLLNYAAWIAPPMMLFLGYVLIWGYLPPVGPVFLCGFISLVGAATGEVLNQRQKKK